MSATRLLVVGGSGFIGRHVCRAAVQRGIKVVSLSRTGAPPSLGEEAWMRHVDWQKGSVFDADLTAQLVNDCQGVVHAVGRLVDESTAGFLGQFYRALKQGTTPDQATVDDQTFDQINRDSALKIASVAATNPASSTSTTATPATARSFVFLSTALLDVISPSSPFAAGPTGRYLQAKSEVEQELEQYSAELLRVVNVRLGVVYDDVTIQTHPLAVLSGFASAPSRLLPGTFPLVIPQPIHAHVAANCIVECAVNPRFQGVIQHTQLTPIAENANIAE
eukprot:c7110_g1_i1.p1 GENE.c7110_g1_i1~~c7110_g1_i1.p1  ORF type:complete len:296 (-),score=80.48 c7110_g1_i1:87-920(-)